MNSWAFLENWNLTIKEMDGTKSKSASPMPDGISKQMCQVGTNPISRKLNKILESRIENDKVNHIKFQSKIIHSIHKLILY